MKILFISDTVMPQMESAVNLRRQYNEIELVVSCGDMPSVYLGICPLSIWSSSRPS